MAKFWYDTDQVDELLAEKADLADAVALETATPLAPTQSGHPGTANSAARGDHRHPAQKVPPTVWRYTTGKWVNIRPRLSGAATGRINWLLMAQWWVQTADGSPLSVSAIGTRVISPGSGDSTVKFAIYGTTATGEPNLAAGPLATTPALSTASSTTELSHTLSSTLSLPVGGYWVASISQGTTAATVLTVYSASDLGAWVSGGDGPTPGNPITAKAGQTTFPTSTIELGDDANDVVPVPSFKVA